MKNHRSFFRTQVWNRFSLPQLLLMALATVAPLVIIGSVLARVAGLQSEESMISLALAAGENPGMVTFGAMFLASPVQWLTGRSQIRVRKYLGIVFFWLAVSNFAMFVLEDGIGSSVNQPFLIAGLVALVVAVPLFMTSSRWSQRVLGMRRWRLLHRLTYLVAAALLAHVVLIGDLGLGSALITLGFVARIPRVRRWLAGRRLKRSGSGGQGGQLEQPLVAGESLCLLRLGDAEGDDLVSDTLVLGNASSTL